MVPSPFRLAHLEPCAEAARTQLYDDAEVIDPSRWREISVGLAQQRSRCATSSCMPTRTPPVAELIYARMCEARDR